MNKYELISYLCERKFISTETRNELIELVPDVTDKIVIMSVDKGIETFKHVDRAELMVIMNYLKEKYPDNNAVSTAMLDYIPAMMVLKINNDLNDQRAIPAVEIHSEDDERHSLQIRRLHKIIWSILNKCQDK